VHWISGHDGVAGNIKVDEEAKIAVKSRRDNSTTCRLPLFLWKGVLPSSILALKQTKKRESSNCWNRKWSTSLRHAHTIFRDSKL
ncbi:hypothetical protein BDR06DRAFT_865526, partial [Suillus hirtellus]